MPIKWEQRYDQFGHLPPQTLIALINNDSTPQEYKDLARELLEGKKVTEPEVVEETEQWDGPIIAASMFENYVQKVIAESEKASDAQPVEIEEQTALERFEEFKKKMDPEDVQRIETTVVSEDITKTYDAPEEVQNLYIPVVAHGDEPICTSDPTHCEKCAGVGTCLNHKD